MAKELIPLKLSWIGDSFQHFVLSLELQSQLQAITQHWYAPWQHPDTNDWIWVPSHLGLPEGSAFWELTDVPVFLPKKRVSLLSELRSRLHPSVALKLEALCSRNDITPELWILARSQVRVPNAGWIHEKPVSLQKLDASLPWRIVHRSQIFKNLEKQAQEANIEIHPLHRIEAISRESRNTKVQVIQSAPSGPVEYDRILISSGAEALLRASERERGMSLIQEAAIAGAWRGYTVSVPTAQVSDLPLASLWLTDERGDEFLSTGEMKSSGVRRVLCIPSSTQGDQSTLQVEEFVWLHDFSQWKRWQNKTSPFSFLPLDPQVSNSLATRARELPAIGERKIHTSPQFQRTDVGSRELIHFRHGWVAKPKQDLAPWSLHFKGVIPKSHVRTEPRVSTVSTLSH